MKIRVPTIIAVCVLSGLGAIAQAQDGNKISKVTANQALSDSLLRLYSIDELLSYKDFYETERDRLEAERVKLREKGIQDLEAFIRGHQESNVMDKVVFRLAELYYEKAVEEYHQAQEAYGNALDLYDEGKLAELPTEPQKDFSRPLALYQYILDSFPNSSLMDDASYNIAFITEDLGRKEEAVALYEDFIEKFPASRYIPEVLMRQAEYYFNPPVNQIEQAIAIYEKILDYTESPRYDEALYRLGWSYYRLSDYPRAISYFTMLADDIEKARHLDPESKITNPSLRDESVEYIGLSFLDFKGANGAAAYLDGIGGRDYGLEILQKIGDTYLEVKEEFVNAVEAYRTLLTMYPYAPVAPRIQAKIAEAYRKLGDDELAYVERKNLFNTYREGTDWWRKVESPKAREQAYTLAEHAMRANINLLLDTATETSNENLYAQAVDDSRAYLQAFPKDTNAVRIHWNLALTLDTKLKMPNAAFEEYIKISNLYWDTPFQKEAAKNAVAIAQDFVQKDTVGQGDDLMPLSLAEIREQAKEDSTRLRKSLQLQPQPFTPGEEKLIRAVNNYVKLFPYDEQTAERLSQAGAIYYNKNHFAGALKYFKTLLKHFEKDTLAEYAEFLVMESYFGKLDYKSVEIVAKRLRDKAANPEYSVKANQRLAESIFLQAESLADSAEHFKAAEEYRRVAMEVPDAEFADLALFKAGLEFDQAREFRRAVETYSQLTANYAQSEHYLSAMNNMALDYGELKDFQNAALTFERLGEEDPDSAKAETHLYNASFYFEQAEDWERAIRVNQKFVSRFPESEDADDLFYNIANYYIKLGDIDNANTIYGEYAQKFPDSPRVVETFYRRGEYFESQGDLAQAKIEYESAIRKSDEFLQAGKDANEFFAAEALFRLTELQFDEYAGIAFRLPEAAMRESKKRKKDMLLSIVDNYTKVASYTTIRLYESTYKIGLAYENFAETWARQEIPEVDEAKKIVARKEINQTAAELYERALEAYKNSSEVLTRIAQQYEKSFEDTSAGNSHAGEKVVVADTTLLVARRWIERSQEKISEVIYDIAEINYASVTELLEAPLPAGLDSLTSLEFRNQLIGKFVRPLVNDIVNSHARNLREARELNLDNRWVRSSQVKIISTHRIIGDQYASLAWLALRGYSSKVKEYKYALENDEAMALGISDEMANFIDFSKAFGRATVEAYRLTLEKAREVNVHNFELVQLENDLFSFAYKFAMCADTAARVGSREREFYEEQFQETGNGVFEEGVFAFEDNYFSLTDLTKNILEQGFRIAREYSLENETTERILLALVRSDPETYAPTLGLHVEDATIGSDATWRVNVALQQDWYTESFDDSKWLNPDLVDSSSQFPGYHVQSIWVSLVSGTAKHSADTAGTAIAQATGLQQDSLEVQGAVVDSSKQASPDSMRKAALPLASERAGVAFFRKEFEVAGLPVSGQIQIFVDDSYAFYMNGELISEQRLSPGARPNVHDFTSFLKSGRNILALRAEDLDASGGALDALIFIKSVPGWEQRQTELRAQKAREQENLVFDKGVIPRTP